MSLEMPEGGWVYNRVTTHPGEMLLEEFMLPLNLDAESLAAKLGVPVKELNSVLREEQRVTGDLALRLSRCLGMSAQFWLNLQATYDLSKAQQESGAKIEREVVRYSLTKAA